MNSELLFDSKNVEIERLLLSKVPTDEVTSYILLNKYPLFHYVSDDKNIHVLCLGSGTFVRRMILSMLSVGQMCSPNSARRPKLFIHVVSKNATSSQKELLSDLPMLKDYVTVNHEKAAIEEYAVMTFEDSKDLFKKSVCKDVAQKYGSYCRYVVLSLGADQNNAKLAKAFADEIKAVSSEKVIINYHLNQKSLQELLSSPSENYAKVQILPFGEHLTSHEDEVRALGLKAFRIHYLYEKLYNKNASKYKLMEEFSRDQYSLRSSLATAVHIDYKLASVGAYYSPERSHRSVAFCLGKTIEKYNACLTDPVKYNRLLQLEHIRWMMFMITDGYTPLSQEDFEKYSFRSVNGKYNGSVKCSFDGIKKHPCLAPCNDRGLELPIDQRLWDAYSSETEIDESQYDPLDKISLKIHLLLKKRLLNEILPTVQNMIYDVIGARVKSLKRNTSQDIETYNHLLDLHSDVINTLNAITENNFSVNLFEQLKDLKIALESNGIRLDFLWDSVFHELKIYNEFLLYRDYKSADAVTIDHLLWTKFERDVVLIKPSSESVISEVAAPLIIEPTKLFYLGTEFSQRLKDFFQEHGDNVQVSFVPCDISNADILDQRIKSIMEDTPAAHHVIDITDVPAKTIAALWQFSRKNPDLSITLCDTSDFSLMDVANFPYSSIYRINSLISANDVFELYGARRKGEKDTGDSYFVKLDRDIEKLWDFYKKIKDVTIELSNGIMTKSTPLRHMIALFFSTFSPSNKALAAPEINLSPIKRNYCEATKLPCLFEATVDRSIASDSQLYQLLKKLSECCFIKKADQSKGFEWEESWTDVSIKFCCDNDWYDPLSRLIKHLSHEPIFFSIKDHLSAPDRYFINICSQSQKYFKISKNFSYSFSKNEDYKRTYPGINFCFHDLLDGFKELASLGFIEDLSEDNKNYYFSLSRHAVVDCLEKAGNILEAYLWYSATKTGYFDSIDANYNFCWENKNVENELDVIMTKNATTLLCSCKTSIDIKKEYLYEIVALSKEFSFNTRPVLAYTVQGISPAVLTRAKEMGIAVIGPDILFSDDKDALGKALIEITEGTYDDQKYIDAALLSEGKDTQAADEDPS